MSTDIEAALQTSLDLMRSGEMDAHYAVMELCMGVDSRGHDFYAYMAIKPSRYIAYKSLIANSEPLDPEDYGEVIEYGFAIVPPKEIREKMAAQGFRHDMEAQLMKMTGALS